MAVYDRPGAWLQRPAAEALARADRALRAQGFGILVYDGYRPWFVTKMFWDGTPPSSRMFVSNPADGSRHNRGAAVDLTIVELATGEPVTMPARFDEFSSRSYTNHVGGTDEQRWLRDTLRAAIEAEGFEIYAQEWWHFDLRGWQDYPSCNLPPSALPDGG
jgi:D-alanyl-D-alanine dipeptidase